MADPKQPLQKAHELMRASHYADASKVLEDLLKLDPSNYEAWRLRGDALVQLKRYDKALISYDKAIGIAPTQAQAWMSRGEALRLSENFDEALKSYDKATELEPKYAWAWLSRGDILRRLGRNEEALQTYDRAIALEAANAWIWINRAHSLNSLNRSEEALRSLDRAIELQPEGAWGWIIRGDILAQLGKNDDAFKSYVKATEADLTNVWGWVGMTDVLETLGEFEHALQVCDQAIDATPSRGEIWHRKGRYLTQLNRLPDALAAYEKAQKLYAAADDVTSERAALLSVRDIKRRIAEKRSGAKPSFEVQVLREVRSYLQKDPRQDPFKIIKEREQQCNHYFTRPRTIKASDSFITVLRRWNSYTPKLPNREAGKNGGGYFLVWKGRGIVIDPGFDFMDNFDKAGYSIQDIDAVVLTHAHTDHTADLESILCLKYEEGKQLGRFPKIDLFMNLGTMHKFIGWISRLGIVGDIVTLNVGQVIQQPDYGLILRAMQAKHSEIISSDRCVGLVFELQDGSNTSLRLGITSDTSWSTKIQEQYEGCGLLFLHLGSIGENEFDDSIPIRSRKRLYDGEHLGLIGTTRMIKAVAPQLAVISEFGEELGVDRCCIAEVIDSHLDGKRCFTGDIGLKIRLPDLAIHCDICDCFVDHMSAGTLKQRNQVVYYCSSHTTQEILDKQDTGIP